MEFLFFLCIGKMKKNMDKFEWHGHGQEIEKQDVERVRFSTTNATHIQTIH